MKAAASIFDIMGKRSEEEKLADDHWNWLQDLLEVVHKEAFIHGYKHGKAKKRSKGGIMNGKETI